MSAASDNLKSNQRQLDMDGVEVGVSRQAVEETLEQYADMLAALQSIAELRNKMGTYGDHLREAIEIARSAAAKAEGSAP